MSDDTQLHRDLGRMEAQIATLNAQMTLMQAQVAAMHDAITSAKGGWRVLVGVGTASAAVSAILTKIIGVMWR